jgi:dienelactone hydrolase
MGSLDFKAAVADVADAAAYLRACGARRVGCVGFCMGGALTLAAAQHAGVDAAVPFYGVPDPAICDVRAGLHSCCCTVVFTMLCSALGLCAVLPLNYCADKGRCAAAAAAKHPSPATSHLSAVSPCNNTHIHMHAGQPAAIKVPVQAHFGALDTLAGFSDPAAAEALAAKMSGDVLEMHMWPGCGHAFMNALTPTGLALLKGTQAVLVLCDDCICDCFHTSK